jgi:hypothetical protein
MTSPAWAAMEKTALSSWMLLALSVIEGRLPVRWSRMGTPVCAWRIQDTEGVTQQGHCVLLCRVPAQARRQKKPMQAVQRKMLKRKDVQRQYRFHCNICYTENGMLFPQREGNGPLRPDG